MGKRECGADIMVEAETNDKDSHGSSTGSLNPSLKMEYLYRRDAEMNAKEVAIIAEAKWSVMVSCGDGVFLQMVAKNRNRGVAIGFGILENSAFGKGFDQF